MHRYLGEQASAPLVVGGSKKDGPYQRRCWSVLMRVHAAKADATQSLRLLLWRHVLTLAVLSLRLRLRPPGPTHEAHTGAVWKEARYIKPTDTGRTYLDVDETQEAGKGEGKKERGGATHG
jgi:hypothetical protein